MSAAKIKKGDNVVIRTGKDKGRTGTVLQVLPKDDKVIVGGINIATRHRKASKILRAVSIALKRRCTFRTSRLPIKTASLPASASK